MAGVKEIDIAERFETDVNDLVGGIENNVTLPNDHDFYNLLESTETDDFGAMSLFDNYQDIIDLINPLFTSSFSSFDYADIADVVELNDNIDASHSVDSESLSTVTSPLKQLLLKTSTAKIPKPTTQPLQNASCQPLVIQKQQRYTKGLKTVKQPVQNSYTRGTNKNRLRGKADISARENVKSRSNDEEKSKVKIQGSKALKFPPCSICGGKASGLHYGVNSCEACKGFFRRYIIRNEEYKCNKGGNCKVVNKNRENCSGCRLQKCFDLGMSQENSKLGRYSLSRRTETIKKVNILEGKGIDDDHQATQTRTEPISPSDHTYSELNAVKCIPLFDDIIIEECSPDGMVEELVCAMNNMQPYGPDINTDEHIKNVLLTHHERYRQKLEIYGEMKAVPKEEHYKLFLEYGIDVDGRLNVFKEYVRKIERITERYYNFAKQIPGFKNLANHDQRNLLNASRVEFFIILMHEGYNDEHKILLARNGVPYHIDELADRCFSRILMTTICESYQRLQNLHMSKEEKSLLLALILVFTDRCKLENAQMVDKIQLLVSELLLCHLERTHGAFALKRFAKFIECLLFLRCTSDLYMKEYRQLCKDEVVVKEVPLITEFLIDDW